jgi:hypothetical protein
LVLRRCGWRSGGFAVHPLPEGAADLEGEVGCHSCGAVYVWLLAMVEIEGKMTNVERIENKLCEYKRELERK